MSLNFGDYSADNDTSSTEGVDVAASNYGFKTAVENGMLAWGEYQKLILEGLEEKANEDGFISESERKAIEEQRNRVDYFTKMMPPQQNKEEFYSIKAFDEAIDDLKEKYPNVPRNIIEAVALARAEEKYPSLGPHVSITDPSTMEDEKLNAMLNALGAVDVRDSQMV